MQAPWGRSEEFLADKRCTVALEAAGVTVAVFNPSVVGCEVVRMKWRGVNVQLSPANVFKVAGEVWFGLAAIEEDRMSRSEFAASMQESVQEYFSSIDSLSLSEREAVITVVQQMEAVKSVSNPLFEAVAGSEWDDTEAAPQEEAVGAENEEIQQQELQQIEVQQQEKQQDIKQQIVQTEIGRQLDRLNKEQDREISLENKKLEGREYGDIEPNIVQAQHIVFDRGKSEVA